MYEYRGSPATYSMVCWCQVGPIRIDQDSTLGVTQKGGHTYPLHALARDFLPRVVGNVGEGGPSGVHVMTNCRGLSLATCCIIAV